MIKLLALLAPIFIMSPIFAGNDTGNTEVGMNSNEEGDAGPDSASGPSVSSTGVGSMGDGSAPIIPPPEPVAPPPLPVPPHEVNETPQIPT